MKERIFKALKDKNPIEVPKALAKEEAERLRKGMQERLAQYFGGEAPEQPLEGFMETAQEHVHTGLLANQLIQSNELTADADKVREAVETMASTYEEPEQVVSYYYGNKQRLAEVEAMVLEEQLVDWLLEKATVTDEPTDFETLMNPPQEEEEAAASDNA